MKRLCQGVAPELALLFLQLEMSSKQVAFLHSPINNCIHIPTHCDNKSAYLYVRKNYPCNPRRRLTFMEVGRVVGDKSEDKDIYRILACT